MNREMKEWKKKRKRDMWTRRISSNYKSHRVTYKFPKQDDLAKFIYWMNNRGEKDFHKWNENVP